MTDNRTTKLLPCPFCGGEADVMLSQSRWGQSYTIHHDALGKCPAEYVASMQFATEAEAIAAWNARAELGSEPPYDELLRFLENDWYISASWDGLRKFWCIELTEEGVRMRDAMSGTLTADDIRGLIERHSDESGGNGRDFHNGAYVAIADELNARAERTCEMDEDIGATQTLLTCSKCGYTTRDHSPIFCGGCGAKVVDA